MNTIEKTLLLLGSTIVLNGCFSSEIGEQDNDVEAIEAPTINSLAELANGFPIGVAVPAGDASNSLLSRPALQAVIEQHFNQITAENIMKPAYLQPAEGNFYFDAADALIGYAETNNIAIHGHTLVWHQQSPEWMKNCSSDVDCTDILETHITTVMQHFATKVDSWDVVNEAFLDDGTYRNTGSNGSFWYQKLGPTYIPKAFIAARAADSNAELYYNDYNLENNGDKLASVITLVEEMKDTSIPIDGIGFQMHIKSDFPMISDITQALQRAVDTGLKVKITELDVQLNAAGSATSLTQALSETQKQRYKDIVATYISTVPKAQRGGISVWGVSDSDSWIVDLYGNPDWPLLFDGELNQKQALQGFADALQVETSDSSDVSKVPEDASLFKDDFSGDFNWYKKDASTVTGKFVKNDNEETMDIDIDWSAEGESFDISVALPEAVDISAGVSMQLKVKIPKSIVDAGSLIIQPFIEDENYTPGYTQWLREEFVGDEWVTISIKDIGPQFTYGYIGDEFDFTKLKGIGLQIQAQGGVPAISTIQVAEISIIN